MSSPVRFPLWVSVFALLAPSTALCQTAPAYDELVELFQEWREFQRPHFNEGVPDYTADAMLEQHRGLTEFQTRLAAIDPRDWPVAQAIDHHLVRAEMNGLEFDHRVLRPWARNPSFYTTVINSQSDTPRREGPVIDGAIELWRLRFPLPPARVPGLGAQLRAIPAILEQARENLVEDARDLWIAGIRTQADQSAVLERLIEVLGVDHPELVADAERAKSAIDAFRGWLEAELPGRNGPSGVGVFHYDWYLRNVHLVPYTWQDELRLMERELARSTAHLALVEHRNRDLPPQGLVDNADWVRVSNAAVTEFIGFLEANAVMPIKGYMDGALRVRLSDFTPPERRSFFTQVDVRDPMLLRCHGVHWFDTARIAEEPHESPIRRVPLLYNIWDSRSEGLATAMEEMMLSAGLFEGKPRSQELVYVMVAQRAARAIAGLRMHSNEFDIDEARQFASDYTPRGWMRRDGGLNWGEQALYLEQPGYGTSYLTGKALIESVIAERKSQLGEDFSLPEFMEEFLASGVIPVSLIRWELTGHRDEILRDP